PALRFCDLVEEEEEEEEEKVNEPLVKPMKVLKRCPPRPVSACETRYGNNNNSATTHRRPASIEEREKAYAEARARIFCERNVHSKGSIVGCQEEMKPCKATSSPVSMDDPSEAAAETVQDNQRSKAESMVSRPSPGMGAQYQQQNEGGGGLISAHDRNLPCLWEAALAAVMDSIVQEHHRQVARLLDTTILTDISIIITKQGTQDQRELDTSIRNAMEDAMPIHLLSAPPPVWATVRAIQDITTSPSPSPSPSTNTYITTTSTKDSGIQGIHDSTHLHHHLLRRRRRLHLIITTPHDIAHVSMWRVMDTTAPARMMGMDTVAATIATRTLQK
ncbi:hypothetical protein BGZ54_003923, partial [Gamsiella multidivaricata]